MATLIYIDYHTARSSDVIRLQDPVQGVTAAIGKAVSQVAGVTNVDVHYEGGMLVGGGKSVTYIMGVETEYSMPVDNSEPEF